VGTSVIHRFEEPCFSSLEIEEMGISAESSKWEGVVKTSLGFNQELE
jgi:hypothetical protein